ncbi:MarR family transcriptional regulator, partial [Vibrio vulnificus]
RQHNQLHLDLVRELTRHIDEEQQALLLSCLEKMNQEF